MLHIAKTCTWFYAKPEEKEILKISSGEYMDLPTKRKESANRHAGGSERNHGIRVMFK